MNIKIEEFYELERNDDKQILTGTLHIYLPDINVDLKGIYVTKKKAFWFFNLPSRKSEDENGQNIRYLLFSLRDHEKGDELLQIIRKEGQVYIENYLKTNPKPVKKPQQTIQSTAHKNKDSSTEVKETAPIASKPIIKQWMDPPPLKTKLRNSFKKETSYGM